MQADVPDLEKQTVWTFDPTGLRAGDILLERGRSLKSKAINAVDGEYSHALIWVGGSDFIESVGVGSRTISFARILISEPDRWLLLRPHDASGAARAADEARNLVFKSYNLRGAIGTKVSILKADDPARIFCSELVAEAYARAGIALVEGRSPAEITPNLLRQSRLLSEKRPPFCQTMVTPADIKEFRNRDKAYLTSPMAEELRASQEAFAAVRPLLDKVKAPRGDSTHFPPGNLVDLFYVLQAIEADSAREISGRLLDELERRRYFHLLDEPLSEVGTRLMEQRARAKMRILDDDDLNAELSRIEQLIAGWENSQDRHQQNGYAFKAISTTSPLPLWNRLSEMHLRYAHLFSVLVGLGQSFWDELLAAKATST